MDKKGIKAALHVLDGDDIADVIPLEKEVVTIGRDDGDVSLDDPEVSSSHCQIQLLSGSYHLFDLNSTNGTYLNGQRIVKSRLSPGDILRVGAVDFVFVIGPNAHQLPTPRNRVQAAPLPSPAPAPLPSPTPLPVPQAAPKPPPLEVLSPTLAPAPPPLSPRQAAVQQMTRESPLPEAVPKSLETLLAAIQEERRELLRQARLVIDFEFSDGTREHYEMREQRVTLGRSSGVAKLERDDEISRRHASVQMLADGSLELSDLGSTNGTYLNEIRVQAPRTLRRGDVVRIGQSKARFRLAT